MFPDCNETDWFNAAVTFCVKRGIIAGDDKGYFNPDEPITREQMAKILCEAAGVEQVTDPENTYADDASIAGWAKGLRLRLPGCRHHARRRERQRV